jgi:hypothetical protein
MNQEWGLVRYISGLLRKKVEVLAEVRANVPSVLSVHLLLPHVFFLFQSSSYGSLRQAPLICKGNHGSNPVLGQPLFS